MDTRANRLSGARASWTEVARVAVGDASSPWDISEAAFPFHGARREQLRFLLRYAQLAPSLYNTQPWLFRVDGDTIEILTDRRRTLKHADPQERQLLMSTGGLVAVLRLAGAHFGLQGQVRLMPAAEMLAAVEFRPAPWPDDAWRSLFLTLPKRRRHVVAFDPDTPSGALLASLRALAEQAPARLDFALEASARDALLAIVTQAHARRLADPEFRAELETWLRPGWGTWRDGIPQGSDPPPSARPEFGAPEWSDSAQLTSRAQRYIASSSARAGSCPVLAVLGTVGDTPEDWLAAGELLMQLELMARASGVWLVEFNQAIELPEWRRTLRERLRLGAHPQALVGLGYGAEVPALPRRPLDEMLLSDQSPVFPMH